VVVVVGGGHVFDMAIGDLKRGREGGVVVADVGGVQVGVADDRIRRRDLGVRW
jgi:hypothetical protein